MKSILFIIPTIAILIVKMTYPSTISAKENNEQLLEKFLTIATKNHLLDDNSNNAKFKKDYRLIQNNPKQFLNNLMKEDDFLKNDEIDMYSHNLDFVNYHLLCKNLKHLDFYWESDPAELTNFVKHKIPKIGKLPNIRSDQFYKELTKKIEQNSNYTILNIQLEPDWYDLIFILKTDKKQFLLLAKELSFPIKDY